MSRPLHELVGFRGDKLFNGAVNIDWFATDRTRTHLASESFVFHGPEYHGVSQADVGTAHGHRLLDTASFVRSIVRRCYGLEEEPFTLAIAGYGTGKSHFGLSVASLFNDPHSPTAQAVLASIEAADRNIGLEIRAMLQEANQPCLVVALNGMQSFDLTTQFTQQILRQLKVRDLDTGALDQLRPRFSQAASLVGMANQEVATELLAKCDADSMEDILAGLARQDESTYRRVHDVFSRRGMIIAALRGESIREVIDTAAREYCGPNRPFRSLLVLFDEFGKYTEFATEKSHIAGSGVLQDLFEGIQANSSAVCFTGFIQFELNAYVQRIAPELRNEILRYVARYQTANRVYLSINLETLIAHLFEKKDAQDLDRRFENSAARTESDDIMRDLARWFPQTSNHRLWNDSSQFHKVIRKGCWPLSPYSTWFLFHLAAAGKHLQGRSALALLGKLFERCRERAVDDSDGWCLAPVDFWLDDGLQQELILSEEGGQQGAITHAYASVIANHGGSLTSDQQRLLQAVVLASKMALKAANRLDAVDALAKLAGVQALDADNQLRSLQDEYNVLEWDEAFKQFEILGDAVPRTQFLAWLRQRVASTYDNEGKAKLFASKGRQWCEALTELNCDFAEENKITTREWRYQAVTSNVANFPMHVKLASDRWRGALAVDEPRGTVIYCYVESGRDCSAVAQDASRTLRAAAEEASATAVPILVVLLSDEDNALGQALAELAVLEESVSEKDRLLFGNLIPAHIEKQLELVRNRIEAMIKQRRYVTCFKEELESSRILRAGTELFARIYKTPLTFPFDGFSAARGNAADSCQDLTRDLFVGKLDYDAVLSKPVQTKNRAITVLNDSWGVFGQDGRVLTRPKLPLLRNLTTAWDDMLATGERRLPLSDALQQLCQPPYGANIASAGLLLATFLAPRLDKLMVVRGQQRFAVSQWLQDGLFKGKFIDVKALQGVDLVSLGEKSSEWEILLDEWETAESYAVRVACLRRAENLKERIPVPPLLHYRVDHLEQMAESALTAMAEMEKKQNEAFSRLENGYEHVKLNLVIWGAAQLQDLCDRMQSEAPLWDEQNIELVRPRIERGRQVIIQDLADWLGHQVPKDVKPDTVGEFKHRMLHLTGANLKKLKLTAEFEALEKHVGLVVKDAETAAEAHRLILDAGSWLTAHGEAHRLIRVAESRDLLVQGQKLASNLQGMAERMPLPELIERRTQLSDALAKIKAAIEDVVERASRLWDKKLRSLDDLETCLEEIDALIVAFEGCQADLQDLRAMRHALRLYQEDYKRLSNEQLSWDEFEKLADKTKISTSETIQEGDVPWTPDDVIDAFVKTIAKQRKQASAEWIEAIERASEAVDSISAADANRLHDRASAPPAMLTEPHDKRRKKILQAIEKRLDALKLDWLVEKFRELNGTMRKKFLQMVEEL